MVMLGRREEERSGRRRVRRLTWIIIPSLFSGPHLLEARKGAVFDGHGRIFHRVIFGFGETGGPSLSCFFYCLVIRVRGGCKGGTGVHGRVVGGTLHCGGEET